MCVVNELGELGRSPNFREHFVMQIGSSLPDMKIKDVTCSRDDGDGSGSLPLPPGLQIVFSSLRVVQGQTRAKPRLIANDKDSGAMTCTCGSFNYQHISFVSQWLCTVWGISDPSF